MSQAAAQQPSRKKAVISLLVLLALICRQRRGLFHRPAASGANGAAKGGVSR